MAGSRKDLLTDAPATELVSRLLGRAFSPEKIEEGILGALDDIRLLPIADQTSGTEVLKDQEAALLVAGRLTRAQSILRSQVVGPRCSEPLLMRSRSQSLRLTGNIDADLGLTVRTIGSCVQGVLDGLSN